MAKITAKEAASALSSISSSLADVGILHDAGVATFSRLIGELKGKGNNHVWAYEVDRGYPIRFVDTIDANNNPITPTVVAETVSVNQAEGKQLPFDALCAAVEFDHIYDDRPTPRWHLDLANQKSDGNWQPGPLTHLQYGGHIHQNRNLDCFEKVPRWCHPPMEVGMLCEVVAANFFEEQWLRLRA